MADDLPDFTIVGAGLAGTLLACYLGKAGYRVDLYEKRPDPRLHEPVGGRSINLALSLRGIHALREVGLGEEVLRNAIPLRGRMIHARDGKLTFQPYGKDDSESINSISRAGLNLLLVNAAASFPTVRPFFGQRCTDIDLASTTLDLRDDQTQATSQVPCKVVIGADGAFSAVRYRMQTLERFDYQQDYLNYGYKELTIPPEAGGRIRMEKHALHIWPRQSFMMIALPNIDGSFTCTLFWPYEGPNSFAALETESAIRRFFLEQFPDALPLMPSLIEDYQKNPIGGLVTMRCRPWHLDGKMVLLGDAAHAVVPFLGQGMNAAFEDCTVLAECLAKHRPDCASAFHEYEERRKVHVDALADMCLLNFVEMRDHVGSRLFLWRKHVEHWLHKLLLGWYLPLYTMIQFTRIPYADARRRARRQDRIMGIVMGVLLAAVGLLVLRWIVGS